MAAKKTKVIAFHLPQYHTIPENDRWWGKGFTEWTNVKKAKPLYRNHYQPRVPLHNNYYDLSDDKTMVWQMKLAKKAGISGFCFYHYWFSGKKLLEKPVEGILSNPDADLPFFFCWANEPWTRTWDGKDGAKCILMEQLYGFEKDWIEHFMYLLPFFQDERYMKLDNKPVFAIYSAIRIKKLPDMLRCWNELAVKHGFKGMHVISVNRGTPYAKVVDAVLDFEPFATLYDANGLWKKYGKPHCFDFLKRVPIIKKMLLPVIDYSFLSHKMLTRKRNYRKPYYLGMYVGWDNTARKGADVNYIIEGNSPAKFKAFFEKQYKRSIEENREFLFINAWNEWGEGTYLEPDERWRYKYLKAIREIVDKYDNK